MKIFIVNVDNPQFSNHREFFFVKTTKREKNWKQNIKIGRSVKHVILFSPPQHNLDIIYYFKTKEK